MADDADSGPQRRILSIGSPDWPANAADKVVETVDLIRDKTTGNVVLVVRALVYGLLAAVFGIILLVLLVIVAVRLSDAYLPIGAGVGSATWAAHGFVGLLVTVMGLGAWWARTSSVKPLYGAAIVDAVIVVAIVSYGVIAALV